MLWCTCMTTVLWYMPLRTNRRRGREILNPRTTLNVNVGIITAIKGLIDLTMNL